LGLLPVGEHSRATPRDIETQLPSRSNPWTILRLTWLGEHEDADDQGRLTHNPDTHGFVTAATIARAMVAAIGDPAALGVMAGFHVASDHLDILVAVEETLFGTGPSSQRDYLAVREVRRGFVGAGLPAQALPNLGIPASSPLLLGFRSVHRGTQAPEPNITITECDADMCSRWQERQPTGLPRPLDPGITRTRGAYSLLLR
jgi:hypothetical protein